MAKSTRQLEKRRESTRKTNAQFTKEYLKRVKKKKKKQENIPGCVHPYNKFLIFIQTSRPLHVFHLLSFVSFLEIEKTKDTAEEKTLFF